MLTNCASKTLAAVVSSEAPKMGIKLARKGSGPACAHLGYIICARKTITLRILLLLAARQHPGCSCCLRGSRMPWCLRTGIFRFRAIELKFKFVQNKLFNPKKTKLVVFDRSVPKYHLRNAGVYQNIP